MSEYENAVCAVCGAGYRLCAACRNRKTIRSWRTITDSVECYKIYMILRDYTAGVITRENARRMLEDCALPSVMQGHIEAVVKEIMAP